MIMADDWIIDADIARTPLADAILRLDRKISRAIETTKGINLKPAELGLLTLVGGVGLLGKARSDIQKEIAKCLHQTTPIAAATSTSTILEERTASPSARTSTSAGTTPQPDAFSDVARARLIFG
ncbi:hypothetical protein O6U13_10830 [Sphingomonas faeni]